MRRRAKQRRKAIKGHSVVLYVPCGSHNTDHKSLAPKIMATHTQTHARELDRDYKYLCTHGRRYERAHSKRCTQKTPKCADRHLALTH